MATCHHFLQNPLASACQPFFSPLKGLRPNKWRSEGWIMIFLLSSKLKLLELTDQLSSFTKLLWANPSLPVQQVLRTCDQRQFSLLHLVSTFTLGFKMAPCNFLQNCWLLHVNIFSPQKGLGVGPNKWRSEGWIMIPSVCKTKVAWAHWPTKKFYETVVRYYVLLLKKYEF